MDLSTHRTSEIPVAEDNDAGGSSPLTDTSPQPSQASVRKGFNYSDIPKSKLAELAMKNKWMRDAIPAKRVLSVAECTSNPLVVKIRRDDRKDSAADFRRQYSYGATLDGCTNPFVGTRENVTCIWSKDSRLWRVKSSGIMWVGVHGMDSVCVVTRREDLDWKRVRGGLARSNVQTVLSLFRISVICEIEDLADPSSEVRQRTSWSIEKPFGVVCVLPKFRIESCHEVGYDDKKAVDFLREKMTSETSFTVTETIQTAISAFQLLFEKKLEANEIGVSLMDPNFFLENLEENKYKDPSVQELEICEIEKYLAAINEPGPGEMKEHLGVIDKLSPPSKRKKTSQVLDTHVPSTGGSTTTSDSME